MRNVLVVSKDKALSIMQKRKPKGLFFAAYDNKIVGIINLSNDDQEVKYFDSAEECVKWLLDWSIEPIDELPAHEKLLINVINQLAAIIDQGPIDQGPSLKEIQDYVYHGQQNNSITTAYDFKPTLLSGMYSNELYDDLHLLIIKGFVETKFDGQKTVFTIPARVNIESIAEV